MKDHRIVNMNQPIGSTVNFEINKRIGLKKYFLQGHINRIKKNSRYQYYVG